MYKKNTIVYHSMYMCLYILYVCRPLNLSKHTKFRQYRIPVISIASTRFFKHVIFYSNMFFSPLFDDLMSLYHNFIGCPEGVWIGWKCFSYSEPPTIHGTQREERTERRLRYTVLAAKHLKFCPGLLLGPFSTWKWSKCSFQQIWNERSWKPNSISR